VTIVTVFRSRLRPDVTTDYEALAASIGALAHSMPGFVDESNFVSPDGERVTIVRFADVASHEAWARHPRHLEAQRRGRDEFYLWYHISVAEELSERTFSAP